MQPQTIKLTLSLDARHVTWRLLTSVSFLQMYIRLFFPITIWLSSLNIQLLHSPSTVQFFLSLAQATRFFLFTSVTTTCFFATRRLYSKSVNFRWTVFALKVWCLPSFMMVAMSEVASFYFVLQPEKVDWCPCQWIVSSYPSHFDFPQSQIP